MGEGVRETAQPRNIRRLCVSCRSPGLGKERRWASEGCVLTSHQQDCNRKIQKPHMRPGRRRSRMQPWRPASQGRTTWMNHYLKLRSTRFNGIFARYNVTFDPALDPADALRARVYREFRKGLVSVIPIRSVKSILSSSVPKTQETVQLATGLRVEFEKESFADVSSAVQYYFGLRTLMNAWAWAGCYTTKDHDGTTKMMMTLSNATNYADEALRSCMEFAGGSVSWLAKNDTLTRGKLASLVRRGYCVQSALEESLRQTHLEWRAPSLQAVPQPAAGPDRKRAAPPVTEPEMPEPKRTRHLKGDKHTTISMLKGGKRICKAYNDGRGCKGGCGAEHVCDVKLPNGKPCAKSSHSRLQHEATE